MASTLKADVVCVYDSLYDDLDHSTMETVQFQFSNKTIQVVPSQKQLGFDDCGVFAIANAVHLAKGGDPADAKFSQNLMRSHLIKCFEELKMTTFL